MKNFTIALQNIYAQLHIQGFSDRWPWSIVCNIKIKICHPSKNYITHTHTNIKTTHQWKPTTTKEGEDEGKEQGPQ